MHTFPKLALLSALLACSAPVAFACTISQASIALTPSFETGAYTLLADVAPNSGLLYGSSSAPSAISSALVHCFDGGTCGAANTVSTSALALVSALDASAFTQISTPASTPNFATGVATAIAAEPDSLLMLGTGLLAAPVVFLIRRRSIV